MIYIAKSNKNESFESMINKKEEVDDKEALMNVYVAIRRAEKLTYIAIQHDTIRGRIKEFKNY